MERGRQADRPNQRCEEVMASAVNSTAVHCTPTTLYFELAKGLPTAFVALVIGLIAVGIAHRRVKLAQAQLKLDLFEKRFGVFLEVRKVLSDVAASGVYRSGGELSPFNALIPQAAFLFEPEVEAYLKKAVRQWVALWAIQMRTQGNGAVVPPTDVVKAAELIRWFNQEASEGAVRVFGQYLNLQKVR